MLVTKRKPNFKETKIINKNKQGFLEEMNVLKTTIVDV